MNRNRKSALRQIKRRAKRKQTSAPIPSLNGFAFEVLTRPDVSKEHKSVFKKMLNNNLERMKNTDAQSDINEALDLIKKTFEAEPKPISCGASCSACCHQKVDILSIEEEPIWDYVQKNDIKINEEKLLLQAKTENIYSLDYEDRGCVFLDENDNCRIYEVRPLVCRRYYVLSDPKHCKTADRSLIDYSSNFSCDTFLSGLMTKYSFQSIAIFLKKKLNLN